MNSAIILCFYALHSYFKNRYVLRWQLKVHKAMSISTYPYGCCDLELTSALASLTLAHILMDVVTLNWPWVWHRCDPVYPWCDPWRTRSVRRHAPAAARSSTPSPELTAADHWWNCPLCRRCGRVHLVRACACPWTAWRSHTQGHTGCYEHLSYIVYIHTLIVFEVCNDTQCGDTQI